MKIIERLEEYPDLNRAFLSYLLLGAMDTVHHLHAAVALGQNKAIHGFWIGIVLIPVASLMVVRFLYSKNKYLVWVFFAIAGLAIVVPGFYHGGWDHLVKLLAFLRIDGESTDIYSLFPADNFDFWFYEITGLLEFITAVVSSLFLYKAMTKKY